MFDTCQSQVNPSDIRGAAQGSDPVGGTRINFDLNVATKVVFEPLDSKTAVVIDSGMVSAGVQGLTTLMRSMGWQVGCLYNQGTEETPQLFWAHRFNAGNPYVRAGQVRGGLDRLDLDR